MWIPTPGRNKKTEPHNDIEKHSKNEINKKLCPNCGKQIDADSNFCMHYGHKITPEFKYCGNCGKQISPDDKFCMHYGQPLNFS